MVRRQCSTVPHRRVTLANHVIGLTLEESTDVTALQRELNRVENHIKEISLNKKSKFSDREHKEVLKVSTRNILLHCCLNHDSFGGWKGIVLQGWLW